MMLRIRLLTIFFLAVAISGFSQVRLLDYYIRQGEANSPLLKDLENQVHSNTLDSLIIRATRMPQVNFNGTLMYAPVINGFGYSESITNGGNFLSVISVSQPLFNKKTVEAQSSKITLQNRLAGNSLVITKRDLKKTITAQYLAACSVQGDISISRILISQAKEEEKLLAGMVRSGIYRQSDYLSFLLELETLEFQLNDQQAQYQRAIADLNLLCGLSDTVTCELVLPELAHANTAPPDGSLFFQHFVIDSLRIETDRILANRSYKPRMGWFTDAGMVNNDPAVIYKNLGMSFGLSFSLPVYDGNQRKLNIEKLTTTETTRQNYRDFFRLQYLQQLRQLNQSLKLTSELIPRLQSQLDIAGSIVRMDRQLLEHGSISVTDYVTAMKNYIAIQANMNQYRIRVLQILNEINYWKD